MTEDMNDIPIEDTSMPPNTQVDQFVKISQSDLDPLNNNSFSDSWSGSPGSGDLADVDLSQHTFDDISWKLTPVSADDVLKAFPGDENLFQCPA